MQYHDFVEGKNKILVSTDAIGMGVNLPIRRIIFMNSKKFDGDEIRTLTSQEIKQIAGPSEVLLKIKGLLLRDKLALWGTREEKVPIYKKMDIRDYVFILDKIKRYKLEEVIECFSA